MIAVTCAIIVDEEGRVLVAQRSAAMKLPLKMEFPGGKVEEGETPQAGLIREIREELGVDIAIIAEIPANEHHYPDFSIRLIPYTCRIISGEIFLKEHAAYFWQAPHNLTELDWAAADIPVVHNYLAHIGAKDN
ncbi:(deoxy)nucleoside triphosphate pyrophosphohydrolase [Pedobacter africanus]|uniref:8-oxo-dGTP diphosphatase n=1 Tax=Pedobacter africanus TaxID=151894 RepID=A0A1W2CPS7_9SPHI|nr:(deoxy)nucleoside triphosphate pyrophosphohydrolase [Pedobacter africanus]SMC86628.1 8-oxo-dGTP diphosphatase [Pedobacter africanus]